MDAAPFQLEITTDAPAAFHAPTCSASSLLQEAAELLNDAAECERMGKPAHAKSYLRISIEKLYEAEKAMIGQP